MHGSSLHQRKARAGKSRWMQRLLLLQQGREDVRISPTRAQ